MHPLAVRVASYTLLLVLGAIAVLKAAFSYKVNQSLTVTLVPIAAIVCLIIAYEVRLWRDRRTAGERLLNPEDNPPSYDQCRSQQPPPTYEEAVVEIC